MATRESPSQEEVKQLTSGFYSKYHKVLKELDSVYQGTFDETEASSMASLCLLAQAALISELGSAEIKARGIKRDVEFRKAEVFAEFKMGEKKMTDALVAQMVTKDDQVKKLSDEQSICEREAKELTNILSLLKDAHLTFRSIKKGT